MIFLKKLFNVPEMSGGTGVMSYRPWVIMAIFPGYPPREVGRTRHRADAEAYVRFLQRYMTQGSFYVMFEGDSADEDPLPRRKGE
jgi:hypothetical protein